MKRLKIILPALAVSAMLLAACSGGGGGGGGNSPATPASSSIPQTGGTSVYGTSVPNTGATEAAPTLSANATGVTLPTAAVTAGAVSTTAIEPTAAATTAGSVATSAATGVSTQAATAGSTQTSLSTEVANSGVTPVPPVIPSTGSGNGQLVSLASMLRYQVVDSGGTAIGTVRDYIVNTCEAHILYVVVTPYDTLNLPGGKQLLIPYEAFLSTPNGSKIDPNAGVLTLNTTASSLSNAPTVDVTTLDLQNPTWDNDIMAYWKQTFRLALTTGCNVPAPGAAGTPGVGTVVASGTAVPAGTGVAPTAGSVVSTGQPAVSGTPAAGFAPTFAATRTANRQTIYRIGLASQILNAPLVEYNGTAIGQTRDVAVIVQTGGIIYVVVEAAPGAAGAASTATAIPAQGTGRMVALPPGAVNIRYQNNTGGKLSPVLVLLAQTSVFQQAPAYNGSTGTNQPEWFNFWQQYVPMTQSQLP